LDAEVIDLEAELDELAGLQAMFTTLRVAVPDDPELAEFILEVTEAERDSGIAFIDVVAEPPVDPGPAELTEVTVTIVAEGGYFQVLDFINRLSRLDRIYVIDDIGVRSLEASDLLGPPELSVVLTGRIFTTALVPVNVAAATDDASEGESADTPDDVTESDSGSGDGSDSEDGGEGS
jgi:Tfp pilus assembly protein PilO